MPFTIAERRTRRSTDSQIIPCKIKRKYRCGVWITKNSVDSPWFIACRKKLLHNFVAK